MTKVGRMERLVDEAVRLVSPRRAAFRAHFRLMDRNSTYRDLILTELRTRGYRDAQSSQNKTAWLAQDRHADLEVLPDAASLRAKSQALNREDPIGSGLVRTFVNNVVGIGQHPEARTDDKDKNARMEAVWADRCEHLFPAEAIAFFRIQRMVYGKVFEDGGILVKRSKPDPAVPVSFELAEVNRIGAPLAARPVAGGSIRGGVERDALGVPVAYWISKSGAVTSLSLKDFVRVPAESVAYLRDVERPGQTHGVPRFHAVLQDLHDLDLLLLASLKRIQIAACLAIFIRSEQGVEDLVQATARRYGYQLDQTIEPGMIWKLWPGESVETLIPGFPTPELGPFVIMIARRIGAALGVSWQVVLKDFSESTYSSARTDLLEARIEYGCQQHWMEVEFLNWVWLSVMEDARLMGDERLAGITDRELRMLTWIANGWAWVDPLKEAQAIELKMRLRLSTLQEECASQGKDWQEVLWQSLLEEKAEIEWRRELELPERPVPALPGKALPPADKTGDAADGNGDGDDKTPAQKAARHQRLWGGISHALR